MSSRAPDQFSSRPFLCVLSALCALLAFSLAPHATAVAETPADPFADEYLPPEPEGTGTAAGQLRGLVTVGARHVDEIEPEIAITGELVTFANLGVRMTLGGAVLGLSNDPRTIGIGIGPSLHLLPYRPVDIALFFEGGVAVVDPTSSDAAPMPTVAGGLDFDISMGPYWFLRFEGLLSWGVFQRGGSGVSVFSQTVRVGIGVQI